MSSSGSYQALWPGGTPAVELFSPARRPTDLNGLRFAFVWDYLFRGDEIFAILERTLRAKYPDAVFFGHDLFGNTLGADDHKVLAELPAKLAQHRIDVVISGIGCCGACTPAVVRASAVIEKAGIPTASLVCEGFAGQARAVSPGLGCSWLPIVEMPAYVDNLTDDELDHMVVSHTTDAVVRSLTETPSKLEAVVGMCGPATVVATGDFAAINEKFSNEGWSDGLPIVPPTRQLVEEFMRFTPEPPEKLIGCVQPSGAGVTPWNVAVNGAMAGCAPAYMPILMAIAEIIVDPNYGVEHSGDTTGGDPLIILSGPIVRSLGFNCGAGVLREGTRANSTVGRFLRLFLRNVVGLRPGGGDKCTFGHSARAVLAESGQEVDKLGWTTFAERRGFAKDTNVVTIGRFTGDTVVGSIYGRDPDAIVMYLADGLVRQNSWELCFTAGLAPGTQRPLLAISPMVAKTLAKAGCDLADLQQRLFRHARLPASKFETYIGSWSNTVPGRRTLRQLHRDGLASVQFAESDDPGRLVPIVERAEDILIVVAGDPYRSNAMAFGSNGLHGFPTSREITTV
ncbi:hypothetical protein LPW26_02935 [Rhodopseudomonas sp. HC1]|uniref:UGSC family (seleno)protein n=1 Tax=Rhodopseudomonas infernalis TaxID=2897386 RepID=UPI001EE8E87C|nr:hypothetical protein [Rhodopseudomonas infernalis]MCG6203584.1 hypothetical protein [Rhodopseudomonas infernalis]